MLQVLQILCAIPMRAEAWYICTPLALLAFALCTVDAIVSACRVKGCAYTVQMQYIQLMHTVSWRAETKCVTI